MVGSTWQVPWQVGIWWYNVSTQHAKTVTTVHLFMQQTPHVHSLLGKKCGEVLSFSFFSFPSKKGHDTAIQAALQKMPLFRPKTPETLLLSLPHPSLEMCFLSWVVRNSFPRPATGSYDAALIWWWELSALLIYTFIFLLLNLQVIIKHCMSTDQPEELIKESLLM